MIRCLVIRDAIRAWIVALAVRAPRKMSRAISASR